MAHMPINISLDFRGAYVMFRYNQANDCLIVCVLVLYVTVCS